jgi:hyperosmotically inducible protein
MSRKLSALAAILLLLTGSAKAGVGDQSDLQLFHEVAATITRYPQFTIFDSVDLDVQDGTVTLTGDVTMPFKREEIEKRVATLTGVREVRNRIRVLPVSTSDDRLRYRIARAIYDNPHFWNYAIGPNPPIHIIVDGGRVTLTGTVNNDMDRTIARSLAHQFPAMSVTNHLKTAAEVREELDAVK